MRTRLLHICVFFSCTGFWSLAFGTHFVSPSSTNPVPPYESWETAATNLQDALAISFSGDTVVATNGIYTLGSGSAGGASNRAVIPTNVTLASVNGPEVTVIDGGNAVRGAYIQAGAMLTGFTVRNGYVLYPAHAGGVFLEPAGTVSNCVIRNCVQSRPGASGAEPGGGGVYLHGGGTVVRCTIHHNASSNSGGGVCVQGNGALRNCVIYANSAFWGGGVYSGGRCTMVNCTLAGNNSSGDGKGLTLRDFQASSYLYNNIIYGNSGGPEWGLGGSGFSADCGYNCTTPALGANGVTAAPDYVDPAIGNYRLLFGSVGIDAGTNMVDGVIDLDGVHRPLDGDLDGSERWDIGAYEFIPPIGEPALAVTSPAELQLFPWTLAQAAVAGTAQHVVGLLHWTNLSTRASGTLNAGSPWTAPAVGLAPGTNEWRISGSNLYGVVAQAQVRIVRGGYGTPLVKLATTNTTHPFWMVDISGSHNEHVAGKLTWTNLANGLSGTLPASTNWNTTVPRLSVGDNPIVFTGTNLLGTVSTAAVTVTRSPFTTRYVSMQGSASPPYTNWATAANDIQTAVSASADGDEVVVAPGTWYVTSTLTITNGIVVRASQPGFALIRPMWECRCVLMHHKYAKLDGFRVAYGVLYLDEGEGAGICCVNGTIQNCLIMSCYSGDGTGGVLLINGRMQNCTIVFNSSFYFLYTGVRCDTGGRVENCIMRFNRPRGQTTEYNAGGGGTFLNCATYPSKGENCVTNFPRFRDQAVVDYRLKADSPCIDTGADIGAWLDHDANGLPRPIACHAGPSAQYDIGAYEFIPIISAAGGSHGSVCPDGDVAVPWGASTSFLVRADAYCRIAGLQTNGTGVAAADGLCVYTSLWENVRDYGRIDAAFSADLASQGTPHWWLAEHGLTNGGISFDEAEAGNTDGDSFTAAEEYICDTDPTNPCSAFCISGVVMNPPVTVLFESSSNRVYRLYGRSGLTNGAWTNVLVAGPRAGGGGADAMTDTNAAPRFYRLGVQLP